MSDYGNQMPTQASRPSFWRTSKLWRKSQHDELSQPRQSPYRLLVLIVAAVFIAEVVAMIIIAIIMDQASKPIPYYQITLIDAGIMTILIFPALYYLYFHPLMRLYEVEHRARQMAETMRAATQALTQTLDLDTVVNKLLKYVSALVDNDLASILLLEDETRLVMRAAKGFDEDSDLRPNHAAPMDIGANSFFQKLNETRQSQLIYDTDQESGWIAYSGTKRIRSWLGVPVLVNDRVIGIVLLGKTQPRFFRQRHAELAEMLVSQAAVAIQNAWLFEQVRAGRERMQLLSHRLVEIQETERRYIARELHDQAGQSLSFLILGLGQLEKDADQLVDTQAHINKLKLLTGNILEDLHRLAVNLRPASLDHLGLVSTLDQFIRIFAEESHLQIHFKPIGLEESDRLPADTETTLYRIVQESLTNILRHAKATHADVILERRDDSLLLIVEDNGVGFDTELPRPSHHVGLLGIQERAEMLGGILTIESVPGQGTTIVVEVPNVHPNPAG